MIGEERTLVGDVVTRLVRRFSLASMAPGAEPENRYISHRHRIELRFHPDLGTLLLRSTPIGGHPWELTFRAIGSARNWFTASIDAPDSLDETALSLLHEIDRALDGLLRQALLARQTLLARRRDAIVRMGRAILTEHAALQRLDHSLDLRSRQDDPFPVADVFKRTDDLREQWLAIPEGQSTPDRPERWQHADLIIGSPDEGFRFYLECVMHASSAGKAAQYLAGEIASVLHDGQLSASIEPIDPFGSFIDDQLRAFFDVVLDARDETDTRSVPVASSFQIAMERLGA
jgi:hypothetical protein